MNRLKISIRLLIITIGLLLFLQVTSFASTGKSTATNVRVRKSASTESEVIELLGVDDVVEILGEEGDWYKINFKGTTGYVSKSFIGVSENTEEKKSEENTAQKQEENNNVSEQTSEQDDEKLEANNTSSEEKNEQKNEQENREDNKSDETVNVQETTTAPANKVYKIAETTKVNILPVITSEYIGELKANDSVTLVSNAGLWVYINSDNVSGWIRIDKLSTEVVEVSPAEENAKENDNEETETDATENNDDENNKSEYTTKTMYAKSAAINVRSEANTSSEVVESIALNTQVKVVGEENDWYKVEINGKTGYIRNDLLSNEKIEVSSRNNDIDRATAQSATENSTKTENASQANTSTKQSSTSQSTAKAETNTSNSASTSSSGVTGADIAAYAKQFVGCRYVYGASGPSSFDCSGLTMYVYKHFGYSLSHSSKVQATQGKAVTGALQPGDILVFSNDGKTVGHVGIYLGNDKFVHASDSSTGVIISNLSDRWNKSKYWGARRIL